MTLKELLKDRKLTQEELAAKLGVGQSAVSNWIGNRSRPTAIHIRKMAEILDVSAVDLLDMILGE